MAVTINSQIQGQQFNSVATYCYLYEPLRVVLSEDDNTAQKFYIDLEILDTQDNTVVVEDNFRYGDFDINPGKSISVDLMKLARQRHDAQVYKISEINNISTAQSGWKSVVSQYIYNFKIYSDINTTPISVKKIPIIGGRLFGDFIPQVGISQNLTEADVNGLDLSERWLGYPYFTNQLSDPSLQDARPILSSQIATAGVEPCAGMIIWKSRLGGWMNWGMDIKTESFKHKYDDNLEVGMFDSTEDIDGDPFVPVNYTGVETSYSITLKCLSLTNQELKAVSGINSSPVVYYMKDNSGKLELMRMNSATTPLSSLSNGNDFSVSLSSISSSMQKTR